MTAYQMTLARKVSSAGSSSNKTSTPAKNTAKKVNGLLVKTSYHRMIITDMASKRQMIVPYAPRETTHSNLSWTWDEVARAGLNPILVNSAKPRPHMSFTLQFGRVDRAPVTTNLQLLQTFARQGSELYVQYSKYENGLYRIASLTVNVTQRDGATDQPTQATADVEFALVAYKTSLNGPASGGKKSSSGSDNSKNGSSHPKTRKYKVKKGDTLHHLAIKFYNDASYWKFIATANKIKNPKARTALKTGRWLVIPRKKP